MAEETYQGTVANIRYNHMAYPWDSPLSFGVQAFIEYNGLIMNDRYKSDVIRVVSITGLDDAEVRDNREDRASAHGQYAYDAFYGGRVLVLNGFIESSSLQVMNYLKKNLQAAFAPLEESPLKFRWFDIYDSFDDPNSILEYRKEASLVKAPSGNYTPLIGSINNLKIKNSLLEWVEPGENYIVRTSEQRTFCDARATLKVIASTILEPSSIGVICSVKNKENYIRMMYNISGGNAAITIEVISNNEKFVIAEKKLSSLPKLGEVFWIRGVKEGNYLTVEYWTQEPSNELFPTTYVSEYLTGTDESEFGDKILAQMGFGGNQANNKWRFDSFKIESLYPGDVEFKARKLSPISIKDEQITLSKFKRPFQIVMKASDFRAKTSVKYRRSIVPSISTAPQLGRKYPKTYPVRYKFYTSTPLLKNNILSINNRGTVFVEPTMYLYGPGENISITNLINGQELNWFGNVNENDYLVIDCREETINNSLGANFIEPLSSESSWIKLEPMWNELYINGSGFTSSTKFAVFARHGYI